MAQLIDFAKLGGPVYVGRANGSEARQRLKLDALDGEKQTIRVLIPDQTYAVNSSFFLGMFGPSLVRFGSRKAFLSHYELHAPEHITETLKLVIDRALASRGNLALSA